jgi:hypothetical protein
MCWFALLCYNEFSGADTIIAGNLYKINTGRDAFCIYFDAGACGYKSSNLFSCN